MSLDTTLTSLELTPDLVLTRLKENNPSEARSIADLLLKKQVPRTTINGTVYHYLKDLCYQDLTRAREIIEHFRGRPYQWENWLPSEAQLTLKNPEPTPNYG